MALYLAGAAVSGRASILARRPLLDGLAPPTPYRWVSPPPDLAASNKPPASTRFTVELTAEGSQLGAFSTSDGQVNLVLSQGAVPPRSGQRGVEVTIEPVDPATLGPAPSGLVTAGNAYQIQASYQPSGDQVETLAGQSSIGLVYPLLNTAVADPGGHQVLSSADGQAWESLLERRHPRHPPGQRRAGQDRLRRGRGGAVGRRVGERAPQPDPAAGHRDRGRDRGRRPGAAAARALAARATGTGAPPMSRGRAGRRAGLVAGLALLLLGASAGPAAAHAIGTGTEASNYRTRIRGIDQGVPGVTVRTVAGGQLELTNRSGQEVVVLGYRLEPYLRIGPGGVYENQRSPSTYTNRFRAAPAEIPPEFDPAAAPEWRRVGDGPSAAWHDHRAHWSSPDPPAVKANPRASHVIVPDWRIPVRQGDHDHGDPGRHHLGARAVAVAVGAGRGGPVRRRPGRRRRLPPARVLAVVALVAVAADMVHTAGALLASTAPLATELYGTVTSAAGWALAGLAAWRLLRGRADSGLLYLLLGGVFLTLAGALPDLSSLGRSQLVSGFGPVVTRAAITFTLGLGAAMVVAGLAGFRSPRRAEKAGVS